MKFLKLHHDGKEVLVNMSVVSEIYSVHGEENSSLCFNFEDFDVGDEQANIIVDESLDEIYQKLNKVSLIIK